MTKFNIIKNIYFYKIILYKGMDISINILIIY